MIKSIIQQVLNQSLDVFFEYDLYFSIVLMFFHKNNCTICVKSIVLQFDLQFLKLLFWINTNIPKSDNFESLA